MQKHGGIEINMSLTRELNREGVIRRTKYKRERERESIERTCQNCWDMTGGPFSYSKTYGLSHVTQLLVGLSGYLREITLRDLVPGIRLLATCLLRMVLLYSKRVKVH